MQGCIDASIDGCDNNYLGILIPKGEDYHEFSITLSPMVLAILYHEFSIMQMHGEATFDNLTVPSVGVHLIEFGLKL